jgi:prolyl oligopeptidase
LYNRLASEVSYEGKYLHIFPIIGTQQNLWYYCELDGKPINSSLKLIPVIENVDATYGYVTNDGPITYVLTQKNAPNYRLVSINIQNPKEVSL